MELIEKMARAIYRRDQPSFKDADFDKLDSILQAQFKGLAQAALTALIEHVGGDGVTEGDKRAATELMVGPKVAGGDGQTYVLRPPSYSEASEAFARHRATAFAAGKAAREREIVAWLRGHEAFSHIGGQFMADAIERGEV